MAPHKFIWKQEWFKFYNKIHPQNMMSIVHIKFKSHVINKVCLQKLDAKYMSLIGTITLYL